MSQIGRHFRLADEPGAGVFCGLNGVFVGAVPLLERHRDSNGTEAWQPRPAHDLNRDLRKCYGMPVDVEGKMSGLSAICRALNRGDLIHAQIATLHLQIPDPPRMEKSGPVGSSTSDLDHVLRASGLLKVEWDEEKHPRWPAGSPDSVGGQFSPANIASGDSVSPGQVAVGQSAPMTTAQAGTLVAPRAAPIPFPKEIPRIPPIPLTPDISPRRELENPYPDRPECEEEWQHALKYCWKLMSKGLLGTDGHRGAGSSFYKCVLGQVREDCGGNPTA
jgi:hypothetical protein